jgi:hypothetical protein
MQQAFRSATWPEKGSGRKRRGCLDAQLLDGPQQTLLHSLGEEGSRIINVIWQPTRDIPTEIGPITSPSGYVIVLEYPR